MSQNWFVRWDMIFSSEISGPESIIWLVEFWFYNGRKIMIPRMRHILCRINHFPFLSFFFKSSKKALLTVTLNRLFDINRFRDSFFWWFSRKFKIDKAELWLLSASHSLWNDFYYQPVFSISIVLWHITAVKN